MPFIQERNLGFKHRCTHGGVGVGVYLMYSLKRLKYMYSLLLPLLLNVGSEDRISQDRIRRSELFFQQIGTPLFRISKVLQCLK